MRYTLEIAHVDTCLSDYVLDHCNGDDEQLFGVHVDGATRVYTVKSDLASEIRAYGDKLPEEINDEQVAAAIAETFRGAHPFRAFAPSCERVDDDFSGEIAQAWFRASWAPVND